MARIGASAAFLAVLLLSGCAGARYQLVAPSPTVAVARNAMLVAPSSAWNRVPRLPTDIPEEENWTANGPILDTISFLGGVADGRPIVKQRRREQQRVPIFRSDMTPQDLVSMVESFYRIRNEVSVFNVTSVQPAQFLGATATRLDFDYVAGDALQRKGRAVMAVIDGKLYMIALDAARSHYFGASEREFDALVSSARLRTGANS